MTKVAYLAERRSRQEPETLHHSVSPTPSSVRALRPVDNLKVGELFFPPLKVRPKMTLKHFLSRMLRLIVDWRWWLGLNSRIIGEAVPPIPLVTVLIPAHNEADRIAQTIESVLQQPNLDTMIVINDGSRDRTGQIADEYAKAYPDKVKVLHREKPSGHKAGALNAALASNLRMAECDAVIDGDTILHPDAFARMLRHFRDPRIGGVGARVVSGTMLEESGFAYKAKDGENTTAHLLAKPAQSHVGALLVSAGCCTIFRKEVLDRIGGFKLGTSAEDMELSWRASALCELAYEPTAICYSAEPPTLGVYIRQRRRWISGFLECYQMHILGGNMRKQNFRLWCMANHVFITGILGLPLLFLLILTGSHVALRNLLQSAGFQPNEAGIWALAVVSPLLLNLLALIGMLFLGARDVAKVEGKRVDVGRIVKNILPAFCANFIVQGVFWYCLWKVFFTANQNTSWGSGNKRG